MFLKVFNLFVIVINDGLCFCSTPYIKGIELWERKRNEDVLNIRGEDSKENNFPERPIQFL